MNRVLNRNATKAEVFPPRDTATHAAPSSRRVVSVDALRGLCVAGMVLVNFPADWSLRYHQLSHAEWDGATATDMIFPAFLLLSGFSMVYSFGARNQRGETRGELARHVLARSMLLLGLGLALNALPSFDWHMLHVYGVLQRIAFCYITSGFLVLGTSTFHSEFKVNGGAIVSMMLLLLLGVWAAVRFVQVPGYGSWRFDCNGNLGAVIDRAIFGNRHLSNWGGPARMWDADGLLSCITSIPNLLLGVLTAAWVRRGGSFARTVIGMVLLAGILIATGLLLNLYLVINRKLWTDSFTLLSGGVSLCLFAIFYLWLDGPDTRLNRIRSRWWQTPALVYGSNAILGFVIYTLVLVVHGLFHLQGAHAPANWLPGATYAELCMWINPYNVSLLYGLGAVMLVMGVLWPFHRSKIYLKL